MTDLKSAPFRVAVREIGPTVQIFVARRDTMDDARPVAMIEAAVANMDEKVNEAVLALARAIGDAICRHVLKVEPGDSVILPAKPYQPEGPH